MVSGGIGWCLVTLGGVWGASGDIGWCLVTLGRSGSAREKQGVAGSARKCQEMLGSVRKRPGKPKNNT